MVSIETDPATILAEKCRQQLQSVQQPSDTELTDLTTILDAEANDPNNRVLVIGSKLLEIAKNLIKKHQSPDYVKAYTKPIEKFMQEWQSLKFDDLSKSDPRRIFYDNVKYIIDPPEKSLDLLSQHGITDNQGKTQVTIPGINADYYFVIEKNNQLPEKGYDITFHYQGNGIINS